MLMHLAPVGQVVAQSLCQVNLGGRFLLRRAVIVALVASGEACSCDLAKVREVGAAGHAALQDRRQIRFLKLGHLGRCLACA